MSPVTPSRAFRRAIRWVGRKVLKNGWRAGRWIAWILLPAWLVALVIGALAEWLDHA